jgi:hypothetical protein
MILLLEERILVIKTDKFLLCSNVDYPILVYILSRFLNLSVSCS